MAWTYLMGVNVAPDTNAKDSAVQQARMWAQEARTQRETVLSILRYFGLPEHDYEALHLIRRHLEGSHAKCPTCGVQGTLAVRAEQQFNQALNEGDGSYKP